jgi:diketogulonate reductase-like aldo/keto reductase
MTIICASRKMGLQDTAQLHGNEAKVGQTIRESGYQKLGLQGKEIFVTTKVRSFLTQVTSQGSLLASQNCPCGLRIEWSR